MSKLTLTPEQIKENRRRSLSLFLNAIPYHMAEEGRCPACRQLAYIFERDSITHLAPVCNKHAEERWNLVCDLFC